MALGLGGCTFLKNATMLEQLLEEINFQRTKEMRQLMKDDSGFVVLQGTTYWTDLFVRHFLFQEEQAIDCDDLLFFVRKRHVKGSSRYLPKYETDVEVFRKDSKKLPIGDPEIDWEETVYLNLIVHQFDYTLTLAICTRTSPKELQVLKRHSQKVYASPSRRKMDTKGEGEEMTYPHICFMVDNFDENETVKRVCVGVPGRRPIGRPKYRWSNAVEGNLRELQVRQGVAQRRDEWERLLSEAKTHFGVMAPA
ncbi:uncharacterized protein KIAA0930 homolog [Bombyx mandarina]|uniref:Uncharacterized protein KIAA0930 homolog n=1 Tax=Bombyx mandarina TaxID=7092 RepID=A0A6J2JFD7_BOMMA|nr:uncharacterized protein KIAA0930 homolog [Bombyx mandarina]